GLIAVAVWTSYTQVEDIVSAEASSIACLYRNVTGYPEPARRELQHHVRDYTQSIITQAWPAQMRGEVLDETTRQLSTLQEELVRFEPSTLGQQILHAEALRQFNEVAGMRRKRLHAIGGGLPLVMWAIVLVGAALTIGVTYLLQIERVVQAVLTG